MISFTLIPPSPFFSQVIFPSYKGLLSKELKVKYKPINESSKLEFHVQVIYILAEISGSQVFEVVKSESRYTITKAKEDIIMWPQLMAIAQMAIQNLRDFLSHVVNIDAHLLVIDAMPLERDHHLFEEAAQELNH